MSEREHATNLALHNFIKYVFTKDEVLFFKFSNLFCSFTILGHLVVYLISICCIWRLFDLILMSWSWKIKVKKLLKRWLYISSVGPPSVFSMSVKRSMNSLNRIESRFLESKKIKNQSHICALRIKKSIRSLLSYLVFLSSMILLMEGIQIVANM